MKAFNRTTWLWLSYLNYIFPSTIIFVISILRVWYLQKEWCCDCPSLNQIEQEHPRYLFLFWTFIAKFILFKMISQQKMLHCQNTDNTSMVNKASIIVARNKNIHSVVTFNTHIHTINIVIDRNSITVFEIFKQI